MADVNLNVRPINGDVGGQQELNVQLAEQDIKEFIGQIRGGKSIIPVMTNHLERNRRHKQQFLNISEKIFEHFERKRHPSFKRSKEQSPNLLLSVQIIAESQH